MRGFTTAALVFSLALLSRTALVVTLIAFLVVAGFRGAAGARSSSRDALGAWEGFHGKGGLDWEARKEVEA